MEKSTTNTILFILIGTTLAIFIHLLVCNQNTQKENFQSNDIKPIINKIYNNDYNDDKSKLPGIMNIAKDSIKASNQRRFFIERMDKRVDQIINRIDAYRNKSKQYETNGETS